MKSSRYLIACLLTLSLYQPVLARPRIVAGDQAAERTQALTQQINWLTDFRQAQSQAHSQGKMIFWVQMLGQMSGST
jgi:hypothetical protein